MKKMPTGASLALFTAIGLVVGVLFDQVALGLVAGAALGSIIESIGRSQRGIH